MTNCDLLPLVLQPSPCEEYTAQTCLGFNWVIYKMAKVVNVVDVVIFISQHGCSNGQVQNGIIILQCNLLFSWKKCWQILQSTIMVWVWAISIFWWAGYYYWNQSLQSAFSESNLHSDTGCFCWVVFLLWWSNGFHCFHWMLILFWSLLHKLGVQEFAIYLFGDGTPNLGFWGSWCWPLEWPLHIEMICPTSWDVLWRWWHFELMPLTLFLSATTSPHG